MMVYRRDLKKDPRKEGDFRLCFDCYDKALVEMNEATYIKESESLLRRVVELNERLIKTLEEEDLQDLLCLNKEISAHLNPEDFLSEESSEEEEEDSEEAERLWWCKVQGKKYRMEEAERRTKWMRRLGL